MAGGIKMHRRYGFYVLVMVVGWVLPPVAVLLRFGFGSDFFLNILLTLCGYIPGHGHNFYLQNIRNNDNRKRTPQWATKAGLVKDQSAKRKAQTQWANRYDERTPTRADGYQDDDELPTTARDGVRQQGLLEPESFLDSSSSTTRDERSVDNGYQRQSSDLSLEARNLERSSADDRHHFRKKQSIGHRHTLPTFDNPSSTSYTNDTHKSSKIARRKTNQTIHNPSSLPRRNPDDDQDPYFIRRASSIHVPPSSSSSSNAKLGPLGSPTSTRSFSQKLGFGSSKKSEKKNRFDLANEARSQWENLPQRHSHHNSHSDRPTSGTHNNNDCLNHQF